MAMTRRRGLVILSALLLFLPVPYVVWGSRFAPFAMDLRDHPERFRGGDVILSLNRVLSVGDGVAELGEPGGTCVVAADPHFGLVKDEYVNVTLRFQGDRFAIVGVGRHRTRRMKWLLSAPILAVVGIQALRKLRIERPGAGLALRDA